MAVLVLVFLVWAQSYNGRRDVIASQRTGCERGALSLAALANTLRDDQIANRAVADDPGQPWRTRKARRLEADEQDGALAVLDSHIDRGDWRRLDDPRDQRAVQDGVWINVDGAERFQRPFRCDLAYPAATPFQFIN